MTDSLMGEGGQDRTIRPGCPVASSPPKLLFVATEDWYFVSHRLSLAQAAARAGFDVAVATRVGPEAGGLAASGLRVFPLCQLERAGKKPWRELRAIAELYGIYRDWRPDLVHHVALKPVLYGSIAAYLAGVRAKINALAGLGYVFSSASAKARLLRKFIRPLLTLVLRGKGCRVILQNPDDVKVLAGLGVAQGRIRLIKGAGVDPVRFDVRPVNTERPRVILAARMLWDKGVADFVEVARALRAAKVDATFVLVGDTDPANPSAVPRHQLEAWNEVGDIEWWGRRSDMPEVLGMATIVCLLSTYGEGVPKVLIEAASCGKPLVAYDVPGCREIVHDGENGVLLPAGDVAGVAAALQRLIGDPELRAAMGRLSRELAVGEFSEAVVHARTLDVYRELLAK
jgi:glycosyltransferase involved in cell wall biosynthesis